MNKQLQKPALMPERTSAAAIEFAGTFLLLATIGLCLGSPQAGNLTPLAIGLVLACLIYAGGHISLAHYNPAVTAAFVLCRRIDGAGALLYAAAQLAAAASAAALVAVLRPQQPEQLAVAAGNVFLAETLFTFLLVLVILNVSLARGTAGNQYHGLAIGAAVAAGGWAVGDISAAALNPAVAVGLVLIGKISWADLPVYLAGQFTGAAAAVALFRATAAMQPRQG